jgi:glycosyltransferase involved in cell wall biosynthesis
MRGNQVLKVAFLTRYDRMRASSRVRVYDYLAHLERLGWKSRVLPLPQQMSLPTKIRYLLQAIALARLADVVILQKLVLQERFVRLLRRINRAIVLDLDDAVYAPPDVLCNNQHVQAYYQIITRRLHYTLQQVCCVIVGSRYLADYAEQFHPRVYILPSSVDVAGYPIKPARGSEAAVILGWIGSPENLIDFQPIQSALRKTFKQLNGNAIVKIVSSQPLNLEGVPVYFEPWSLEHEIELLHSFDIGLMPLNNTERTRGRCAFKAIQYMAVGLPVITSAIGSAMDIVMHAKTGFFATTDDDWVEAMTHLIEDPALRVRLGLAGRARVAEYYSIQKNAPKLAEILRKVVGDGYC